VKEYKRTRQLITEHSVICLFNFFKWANYFNSNWNKKIKWAILGTRFLSNI